MYPESAIHQTKITATSDNSIPSLSRLLKVSDVLVADAEVIAQPCKSTIVRTRPPACAVDITIGRCLVVCPIKDKMIEEQTR